MPVDAPDFRSEGGFNVTGDVEIDAFSNVSRITLPLSPEVTAAVKALVGPPGEQGQQGEDGAPGPQGPPGPVSPGTPGAAGPAGIPGADGVDGTDGIPGPPGATGSTGPTGPAGNIGAPGVPGADGVDGTDGTPGATGPAGSNGSIGAPGIPGADGRDGEDGVPGSRGATGATGATGPMGPPGQDGNVGPEGPVGPRGPSADDSYQEQDNASTGTFTDFALAADTTTLFHSSAGARVYTGFTGGIEGRRVIIRAPGAGDTTDLIVLRHNTTSATANQFATPNARDYVLREREEVELQYQAARWRVIDRSHEWHHRISVTWAAQQNDFSGASGKDYIKVTLTGNQTLTGIVPQSATAEGDGQMYLIENVDSVDTLTIAHESASSGTDNRFLCPSSVDFIMPPRSSVVARYDGVSTRWRLITHNIPSIPEFFSDLEVEDGLLTYRSSTDHSWMMEHWDHVGPDGTVTTTGRTIHGGNTNWFAVAVGASGSISQNGTGNMFPSGKLRMTTGANTNDTMEIWRGGSATSVFMAGGTFERFSTSVLLPSVANCGFVIGFTNSGFTEEIEFVFDTASDTSVHAVCTAGGTSTDIDLTFVPATGVGFALEARRNGADVDFYVNGGLFGTITTNVPTNNMSFSVIWFTRTTAAKSIDIDYLYYRLK